MQLGQTLVMEATSEAIVPLEVEGEIFFLNQGGVPVLRLENEGSQNVLVWEESCGVEYVPQFTTTLGRLDLWRQVLVPIRRDGNLRQVKLLPYCHSRIFRLRPRAPGSWTTVPSNLPPKSSCAWWRRWLPRSMRS
jgi:hypothetical protein